jgi:hypothetical protein
MHDLAFHCFTRRAAMAFGGVPISPALQSGKRLPCTLVSTVYPHPNVLAGIDSTEREETTDEERDTKDRLQELREELLKTIILLKEAQQSASDALRDKMQRSTH